MFASLDSHDLRTISSSIANPPSRNTTSRATNGGASTTSNTAATIAASALSPSSTSSDHHQQQNPSSHHQLASNLYQFDDLTSPINDHDSRNYRPSVKRVVDAADRAKKSYFDRSWDKLRTIFRCGLALITINWPYFDFLKIMVKVGNTEAIESF